MRRRLIITERQLSAITRVINENSGYDSIVKEVVRDLDSNYKKAIETYRDGNEYKQRRVFEVVVDGELITPHNLLEYLKLKYSNLGDNFLKQVINDWVDGKIKDGMLSKNIGTKE